ncbi:hypothetical protein LEMLEM_LOCUS11975, partial [Lemmus lemmus]
MAVGFSKEQRRDHRAPLHEVISLSSYCTLNKTLGTIT